MINPDTGIDEPEIWDDYDAANAASQQYDADLASGGSNNLFGTILKDVSGSASGTNSIQGFLNKLMPTVKTNVSLNNQQLTYIGGAVVIVIGLCYFLFSKRKY